jgi:hypothetical protein
VKPITAEELARIRAWVRDGSTRWVGDEVEEVTAVTLSLAAEVERLSAENEAMRKIIRPLAQASTHMLPYSLLEPRYEARKLLGQEANRG